MCDAWECQGETQSIIISSLHQLGSGYVPGAVLSSGLQQ